MSEKTNEYRRDFLILQSLGIIVIVGGHCGMWAFDLDGFLAYGNFNVPLFVFCSGYFFKENVPFFKWIVHKIKKLILPYVLIHMVFKVLNLFLCSYYPFALDTNMGLKSWFLELLMPRTLAGFNSAMWFVPVLLYIEIIFFVSCKIFGKYSDVISLVIFLIIGCIGILMANSEMYVINGSQSDIIMTLLRTVTLLPYISLGYMYKKYFESKKIAINIQIVIYAIVILILGIIFPEICGHRTVMDYKGLSFNNPVCVYFVGLTEILFLLSVSKGLVAVIGESRLVEIIGTNTYYIMAYHFFGFFVINVVLSTLFPQKFDFEKILESPRMAVFGGSPMVNYIYVVGSIAISILINWITSKIIKLVCKPVFQGNH